MIVWLSSFPRSGNTLVRLMLKRVWEIQTCSMYDDRDDIGANPAIAERVGHRFLGGKFDDTYQSMRDSKELFCVKTHDIPIDRGKSIYIVRDGRCASYSYWRYQRDFGHQAGATLADALIGFTPFGSWSDHLDAWNPIERPDTLLLRYEQLIDEPEQQIHRISEFLELQPLHEWKNDFEMLQRLDPRFFREGSSAPSTAFEKAEESLFRLMHGAWMSRLGYMPADAVLVAASHDVRRLFFRCIASNQGQLSSLNLTVSQQRGALELLQERLQALNHQRAEIEALTEDAKRRLISAEQKVATRSRFLLTRAWNALRTFLIHHLAPGRPIRAGIAAILTILAGAIHSE